MTAPVVAGARVAAPPLAMLVVIAADATARARARRRPGGCSVLHGMAPVPADPRSTPRRTARRVALTALAALAVAFACRPAGLRAAPAELAVEVGGEVRRVDPRALALTVVGADGAGSSSALVTLALPGGELTGRTDAAGRVAWFAPALAPRSEVWLRTARVRFRVRAAGHLEATGELPLWSCMRDVGAGREIVLAPDDGAARQRRVRVVDGAGAPVAGARVLCGGPGLEVRWRGLTDAAGELVLAGAAVADTAAELLLVARAPSRGASRFAMLTPEPGGAALELALSRDLGVLAGVARDVEGRPLAGHPVAVERLGAGPEPAWGGEFDRDATVCDEAGRFRIAGLAPGRYRLRFDGDRDGVPAVGYAVEASTGPGSIAWTAPRSLLRLRCVDRDALAITPCRVGVAVWPARDAERVAAAVASGAVGPELARARLGWLSGDAHPAVLDVAPGSFVLVLAELWSHRVVASTRAVPGAGAAGDWVVCVDGAPAQAWAESSLDALP
ncbi:MAG: carboxypeptidase regulatory-like domain-containing protein [Planctomycetes bacterium]|nr:carboxypeptidase regulatory-like domain-containing protein [Planctomycetota bacterium]